MVHTVKLMIPFMECGKIDATLDDKPAIESGSIRMKVASNTIAAFAGNRSADCLTKDLFLGSILLQTSTITILSRFRYHKLQYKWR